MKNNRCILFLLVFSLLAFVAWGFHPSNILAASADGYYQGKTIRILVSSSPGGGTDTTARLFARFLPKYLPGNPRTIVQNMPGGGGVISNNYFYHRAKPDGLTLFQDSSSGLGNFTRGGDRIKYDPRKNIAIGSITRGGSVMMLRKDAKDRFKDPNAKKVVVGDADGIRTWLAVPVWGAEYLGWNVRFIYGYPGTGELMLGLRQGEIEFFGTQNAKLVKDMAKEGEVELVVQQDDERRPDFPDVPTFYELLGDKKPKGVPWEAYLAWSGPTMVDKFLVAPRGTPPEVVKLLREAVKKAAQDPQFKDQATKFYGQAWSVRPGERTQVLIRDATTISPDALKFLTKIRKKYGLPVGKGK